MAVVRRRFGLYLLSPSYHALHHFGLIGCRVISRCTPPLVLQRLRPCPPVTMSPVTLPPPVCLRLSLLFFGAHPTVSCSPTQVDFCCCCCAGEYCPRSPSSLPSTSTCNLCRHTTTPSFSTTPQLVCSSHKRSRLAISVPTILTAMRGNDVISSCQTYVCVRLCK